MEIRTNEPIKEHILVCLSSSPTNERIIRAAAEMAQVLNAKFSALYVQNNSALKDIDKVQLESNVSLAQNLGAKVVVTHGVDVPLQIAEFARLSKVTRIVVGQSNLRRNRFFGMSALTNRLISCAPDIELHVIPDIATFRKAIRHFLFLQSEIPTLKDTLITLSILALCTIIGYFFQRWNLHDSNVILVYLLGILGISVMTKGYVLGIASAVASVLLYIFFLTKPQLSFQTYATGYPVSFAVMLIVSIIASTMAAQMKKQAKISAQAAFRTSILFDTDQLLHKAKSNEECLQLTCTQISKLMECNIIAYTIKDGVLSQCMYFSEEGVVENASTAVSFDNERAIAEWVAQNGQKAGAGTTQFSDALATYYPICIDDRTYGVIGIPVTKHRPDSLANSVLLSVLSECALSMDNARNAREKEQAADMAKSEKLRANLLRSISHDLRTPLTAVYGNADTLLNLSSQLDETTKQRIYQDLYDDSKWLIGVVENLLYVTRLNDGRLRLNPTDYVVEEVIAAAVAHMEHKRNTHKIIVHCDDVILARMDAQLIVQVLVNLIDNAEKYTEAGCEIVISAASKEHFVEISVADNGAGISEEMKPRIFEMFYTGDEQRADSRRSFGIGLTLCKSIVELHGGTITLSDNVPHGSIFTFTLPLSEVMLHEQTTDFSS